MKVSIIIPTFKNNSYLIPCIQEIKKHTGHFDLEIVIVDNAATIETKQIANVFECKYITSTNESYAKSCNVGAVSSIGDFLVFMNDDTLATPKWLDSLMYGYLNLKNFNVGAVGPMTNRCGGRQSIQQNILVENKDQVRNQLPAGAALTGFLSGFCFVIPKKVFNEIDGFDERLRWSHDDNAMAIKLFEKGYNQAFVTNSFVYHHMSTTLNREGIWGLQNEKIFHELYREKLWGNRLGAIIRAKCDNEVQMKHFVMTIDGALGYCDRILIIDDGSEINLEEYIKKASATQESCKKILVRRHQVHKTEIEDRNELLQWLKDEGMDWGISIDADEVFENDFDRRYVEELMQPKMAHLYAYAFHFYTFWNSYDYWYDHEIFGKMHGPRMYKLFPDRKQEVALTGFTKELHNGNIPLLPPENIGNTSIRIKHYGYVSAEERMRKYKWYTEKDPNPDPTLVGAPDYNHLISETNLKLKPWREQNSIGLCTVMKDEAMLMPNYLRQAIPFFREVILIDTGSTDTSDQWAESFGCKVIKHIENPFRFDTARNEYIKNSTTDWIMHMDLDESIGLQDLSQLRRLIDVPHATGWLFEIMNILKDGTVFISETVRLFEREFHDALNSHSKQLYYTGKVHETLDDSIKETKATIYRSPVKIQHIGYLRPTVPEKITKYRNLLLTQIKENPEYFKSYFDLALYDLLDEKTEDLGLEKLLKCHSLNPEFYHCNKELTFFYLRRSHKYLKKLLEIIPKDHFSRSYFENLLNSLEPHAKRPYNPTAS